MRSSIVGSGSLAFIVVLLFAFQINAGAEIFSNGAKSPKVAMKNNHGNEKKTFQLKLKLSSPNVLFIDDGVVLTAMENIVGSSGTSTIMASVFNLAKTILGAGVLSLPFGVASFSDKPSALYLSLIHI